MIGKRLLCNHLARYFVQCIHEDDVSGGWRYTKCDRTLTVDAQLEQDQGVECRVNSPYADVAAADGAGSEWARTATDRMLV